MIDLTAWCRENVTRYREYEHINMAVPPTSEDRDTAIVEWVVRVLGNAELAESREVLRLLLKRHGLVKESELALVDVARMDAIEERDAAKAEVERLRAAADGAAAVAEKALRKWHTNPLHTALAIDVRDALAGGEQS